MAQAARLSLRMQKELKLLLTEPPQGTTFPHLSPDSEPSSSSSSLFAIHAQILGPEGTVYAKGVFEIKIQIPERYPFQPPSVTFSTPIYHPNIDNGGRICLDILNLPPKGAWQPSLNIWTVITSIRLLMSEPNPDDGLMCEASKEYKYNRQVFDQKAISMTEKFAKAGLAGNCSSIETDSNPSTMEVKKAAESKLCADERVFDQKKLSGNRRKLSLESSVSSHKRVGECSNIPNFASSRNPMEVDGIGQASKSSTVDYLSSHDNPNGTRRRLSLESFSQDQKKHLYHDEKSILEEQITSTKQLCQVTQKQPSGSKEACRISNLNDSQRRFSVPQSVDPHSSFIDRTENASTSLKCKNPCLVAKKLSLRNKVSPSKSAKHNKENIAPAPKFLLSSIQILSNKPCADHKLSADPTIPEKSQCNWETDGNVKQQVTEEPPISETVIVLDSEDSEEETNTPPVRTKLSLARRLGKKRAKA